MWDCIDSITKTICSLGMSFEDHIGDNLVDVIDAMSLFNTIY